MFKPIRIYEIFTAAGLALAIPQLSAQTPATPATPAASMKAAETAKAAEKAKPSPSSSSKPVKPLTAEEKLELREIQVRLLKSQGEMAELTSRYSAAQKTAQEASKALQEAIQRIAKSHDCAECEVTESLEIRRRAADGGGRQR